MSPVGLHSNVPFGEVQDLTGALTGAFTEGVDLGPRGEQIRALGASLEAMIEALRPVLRDLSRQAQVDDEAFDLCQLARVAQVARTYGVGESRGEVLAA